MGYQEKTRRSDCSSRWSGTVGTLLLLCPYLHTCTWMDTVLQTVDDRVGGNTYTLCIYLICRS